MIGYYTLKKAEEAQRKAADWHEDVLKWRLRGGAVPKLQEEWARDYYAKARKLLGVE